MSTDTLTKIDHPAAWTVESLMAQQDKWIYQLTADDIAELDAALQQIKARGLIVPKFGTADFPMPKLAAKLKGFIRSLSTGTVSYTHLRAHETVLDLVCRLLLEKKKDQKRHAACKSVRHSEDNHDEA